MAKCTIENTPAGPYLCRCQGCGETFKLDEPNALGRPMRQFMALVKGFEAEHKDCEAQWSEPPDTCEGGECDMHHSCKKHANPPDRFSS